MKERLFNLSIILRLASLWGLVPAALYFRFSGQLEKGQIIIAIAAILMGAGIIMGKLTDKKLGVEDLNG